MAPASRETTGSSRARCDDADEPVSDPRMTPPSVLARLVATGVLVGCAGCASAGVAAAEIATRTAQAVIDGAARSGAAEPACARPCDSGTVCNERSGMCEPYFPRGPAPADAIRPAPPNDDDSCGGLCLEGEHCRIVANSDVECVPDTKP